MIIKYHPLYEKAFSVEVEDATFYFSCERFAEKFREKVDEFTQTHVASWQNRFKVAVDSKSRVVFALQLYYRVETFGFLVVIDGVEFSRPDEIKLTATLSK